MQQKNPSGKPGQVRFLVRDHRRGRGWFYNNRFLTSLSESLFDLGELARAIRFGFGSAWLHES